MHACAGQSFLTIIVCEGGLFLKSMLFVWVDQGEESQTCTPNYNKRLCLCTILTVLAH